MLANPLCPDGFEKTGRRVTTKRRGETESPRNQLPPRDQGKREKKGNINALQLFRKILSRIVIVPALLPQVIVCPAGACLLRFLLGPVYI